MGWWGGRGDWGFGVFGMGFIYSISSLVIWDMHACCAASVASV